jgi:PhnB protein
MLLQPYLNFPGTCAEAFRFYQSTLGGELEIMTHGDAPMEATPENRDLVMHACLKVGDAVLMASDAPAGMFSKAQGTWVSVSVEGVDEAERIFRAFAEGGEVAMPIAETFWSPRFGMVTDRFGTPWMVNAIPAS